MGLYDPSMVRGGLDIKLDFKVDIKRDFRGDIREYFKDCFFVALKGPKKSDGLTNLQWVCMT